MKHLKLTIFSIALVLLLAPTSTTQAQQIMLNAAGGNDMSEQFRQSIASTQKQSEAQIQNRIADIHRAVELSEQQIMKLEIAAKGAIKSHMKKVTKQMVDQAKAMGFEFDPEAEPEEKDEDDAQNQMNAVMGFNMMAINGMGGEGSDVETEKLWTNSLKKVLTEEQAGKFESALAERKAFRRQSAVSHFISRVDRKLLLDKNQREKLTSVIDAKYGEGLANKLGENQNIFFNVMPFGAGGEMEYDTSDVDGLLSDEQIELWKQGFASELTQLDGNVMMALPQAAFFGEAVEVEEGELDEDDEDNEDQ